MHLLRSFRKNLKALKIQKKEYDLKLLDLRAEIAEYERAIEYIERNIKRQKQNVNSKRNKNKSRRAK